MKKFLPLFLCVLLSIFTVARATKSANTPAPDTKMAQQKPTVRQADAKTLLDDANKALAVMIKAARTDEELDPKTPKNKAFWKPAQVVAKNLKLAQTGLQTKSNDFFNGIAEANRAEQQMKIGLQLTDSKNTKLIENGKILGNAIEMLRTNYSKEAARKKQGGELTGKEKAEFETIKAQQKDLLAKISKLEKSAQKDKAVANGPSEIQKQAERITGQPATLDAYIATLYLLDRQIGLIRGYHYYVDTSLRSDYVALIDWIAGYEARYYTWYDTVLYDWTSVDESVDIYEDVTVSESVSEEEISSEESYAETESFDISDAEEQQVTAEENTDEQVAASDENSIEDASDDAGEGMNGDDSGDAAADEDTGDDDGGNDDGGNEG
jgi:hypothetical protein